MLPRLLFRFVLRLRFLVFALAIRFGPRLRGHYRGEELLKGCATIASRFPRSRRAFHRQTLQVAGEAESWSGAPRLPLQDGRRASRLQRADGWLVARGSTQFEAGSPVYVTLNAVMYAETDGLLQTHLETDLDS
ncbi:hypothetical protein [Sinorhizobium sojae]|uniref:hypothetical protein n=1 Tax=Sinorhizobium sojae TaxID=716925 RepID=UPI0013899FEF|nr:hypothetical protein [Sinorhizobium sojae]